MWKKQGPKIAHNGGLVRGRERGWKGNMVYSRIAQGIKKKRKSYSQTSGK